MARRHGAVRARPEHGGRCDEHRRDEPIRTCVGCRTRVAAAGLLRVVAADGTLIPDPRHRLPGRGAWLHPDLGCLRTAKRRRAFPRALRVAGALDTAPVHDHLARLSGDATTGPGPTPDPTGPDYPGARSPKRETGRSDMNQQP